VTQVPVHFIGFLANVNDSILKLSWGEDFSIGKPPANEIDSFLNETQRFYGERGVSTVVSGDPDWDPCPCYCVKKEHVTEYEFPTAATPFPKDEWEKIRQRIEQRVRTLRLFKEGNAVMRSTFLYSGECSKPTLLCSYYRRHVPDRTAFILEDSEIADAQKLIEEITIPFQASFLQTAFEAFEQSYELADQNIAFLSLMIAMEVLLSPKDHYGEITHRISRNAAVVIGRDRKDAEKVFKDMKELYSKRSKIVHEGKRAGVTRQDMQKLRSYVRETLKETMRIGVTKNDILATLNSCGFGERPWRAEQ
jgi:hypothetical protein